jgi:predicted KAP-like P-loop ATPase
MKISDVPVVEDSDDTLGRVGLADLIAEELNSFDLREGAVTAITGSWGSGKTSLINLVKQRLRPKFTILEFNPWLFMSTEDLIVTFFSEVMNELRREQTDYREIIAAIDPYLRALESLKIEPNTAVIGYGAGVVRKLLPHRVPSVTETKKKLRESLKGSERRFVVFIDDLDRLDAMEVREVLRLTRLVGSFPNVLYVLAYDHDRLSRGIANDPVMGNDYLEKMVLAAWRVPHLDTISKKSHLIRFLEQSNILPSTGLSQEAEQRFNGALDNLFVPVMLNLRRIKRYAVAIRLSAKLHRSVRVYSFESSGFRDVCRR